MANATAVETIEDARTKLNEVLNSLTDADLDRVNEETGWTVRMLLAHVSSAELGEVFVIRRAVDGELVEMDIDSRDQFNDMETSKAASKTLGELKADLAESHDAMLEVIGELRSEDMGKAIFWPSFNARTIGDSFPEMAQHELEHAAQVAQVKGSTS